MTPQREPAVDESGQRAADFMCRICRATMEPAGEKTGSFSARRFSLALCPACGFAAVVNPWLEYDKIYDDAYYEGRGADPDINYVEAARHPESAVQSYEWEGIRRNVEWLKTVGPQTRWLDYGCGTGGLVRHLLKSGVSGGVGFEQGWGVSRLVEDGVPHLGSDELSPAAGSFDIVTAIEVIEHAIDPLGDLRVMRSLLKPGGLLFISTGNSRPYRSRLTKWRYVKPEVHISFFDPESLALALRTAGFEVDYPGFGPGWVGMYKTKALMTLGLRHKHRSDRLVPWGLAARAAERQLRLSELPVGRVPA